MADVSSVESVELPVANSLKSLEGRTFNDLPQEVRIGDKGLMQTFRLLSERTKTTNTEWSGFITKDRLGNLSPGYLRPGDEDEAQTVEIRDLTGMEKDHYPSLIQVIADSEKWREGNPDVPPVTIFGRDLGEFDKSKIHKGVILVPQTEFFALMHTHRQKDPHSPTDAWMLAEQTLRADGRPEIPISIVIGPEDMYVIVTSTDGNVRNVGHYHLPEGVMESLKLGTKIMGLSTEESVEKINEYVQNFCRERKFGFYKGSLKDGSLKRLV